ncbi:alpha/beta fold hydrolase [Streptomyces kronopolitis]|uniref:alpha/beta fold hydrolase n=1 Tax=Streptomyces kronopolitis TaxID=1612435 RepID=UPI0020C07E85|nr:alpha/beta fold hydrolase [Streptomyces kronopolitis]MCL6298445.1 alpha/beta fold hydrolase [Streptomyces kronopolitis]
MRLYTHEWGAGERIAVLVHGLMSDHRTWHRVGPALAGRGYRVLAVDLRGHGRSPRGDYGPELFADDLVETLPAAPELALGHSLGGLALSLAVERLRPRRAVYSDPAWSLAGLGQSVDPALFVAFKRADRARVRMFNPRWSEADLDIELATVADWDTATALALSAGHREDRTPHKPVVPSLVQFAGEGFLFSAPAAAELADRGFEVRTVPGVGHTLHRDDFDAFMAGLEGWV